MLYFWSQCDLCRFVSDSDAKKSIALLVTTNTREHLDFIHLEYIVLLPGLTLSR